MQRKNTKISFSSDKSSQKGHEKNVRAVVGELKRKKLLRDSKRCIVANLGRKGIIESKPYWIYDKGQDVTPKTLEDSFFPNVSHTGSVHKLSPKFGTPLLIKDVGSEMQRSSILSFYNKMSNASRVLRPNSRLSAESNFSFGSFIVNKSYLSMEEELPFDDTCDWNRSVAPSMFGLRIDPPLKYKKPHNIFVINLSETHTNYLLEIPSNAEILESEGGKLIVEKNCFYENRLLTTKAISHVAIQSDCVFRKNRLLYIPRNKRKNSSTFVTNWIMYDDLQKTDKLIKSSFHSRQEGRVKAVDVDFEKADYDIQFSYQGTAFSNKLLVALMIVERFVINNIYKENQLSFNGLLVQDPLSLEVVYNYTLKHMWTFNNVMIVGKRPVTSFCWNEADPNILAVGYGKFYYKDECEGLVCIWNVKNPFWPERHYEFKHPVTYVTFNPKKKQILAITFYNGSVLLIDIISWRLLVKASNDHYPLFYPVWQAHWFPSTKKENFQFLITCGKNGNIYRYKKDKFFMSRKLLTVGNVHGKIQGVEKPKPCYAKKTLTMKSPSVNVLVLHPSDPLLYLAGTSDGCVFFCSILHRHEHLGVMQAHTGPVYNIQFNPFCNMVFLTCGMDWCIRIWVEGLYVPLITLQSGMSPVHDAVWSPLHSTVVLSVTDKRVEIWDLRRRTNNPMSSIATPSASFNTKILFTLNRYNVCIGDLEGNVHVMAMTEMPFSPMFQEDILVQALKYALVVNQELLDKLEKLGKPFSSQETSANP